MVNEEDKIEKTVTVTITFPVSEAAKILPGIFKISNDANMGETQATSPRVTQTPDSTVITIPRKKHAGGRPRKIPADSVVLPGQMKETKD